MHTLLTRRSKHRPLFLALALLPFGALGVAHAEMPEPPTPASHDQSAFGALKHVKAGVLDVAYADIARPTARW